MAIDDVPKNDPMAELRELREKLNQVTPPQNLDQAIPSYQGTCPTCGHCPTCGRHYNTPYYPNYPYGPVWMGSHTI